MHYIDFNVKLTSGYYDSKLPYPEEHHTEEEKIELRRAVRADNVRLAAEFKKDVLEYHGLADHPKVEKIWAYVYDITHVYREINDHLNDLAEIVL